MSVPPTILCVGRLYCDLIFTGLPRFPTMGTEVFSGGLSVHAGGGAFITAAHLSALGRASALSAILPTAPFREVVADGIARAGIDMSLCAEADPEADPQVTVAMAGQSDRAFLTRRSGRAFPPLLASDLKTIGASHVHIGELATLVARPELLDLAREVGATVSLDCGWDDDLDVSDVGRLIASVDIFLPNEAELRMLTKKSASRPVAPLTVIKQGRDGASAIAGPAKTRVPANAVAVVDSTGAGDAFNAGFLAEYLAGGSVETSLRAGNARGQLAVSQVGGFRPEGASERTPGLAEQTRAVT